MILILVLIFLLLENFKIALLSLIPVVTGVLAVVAVFPLFGRPLTAPALFAGMMVIGLCIDYGIFMVFDTKYHSSTGTKNAVILSAVTTLIGTGALLMADHPILFSIGLTLSAGIGTGFLSAFFVVPSLYSILEKKGGKDQ